MARRTSKRAIEISCDPAGATAEVLSFYPLVNVWTDQQVSAGEPTTVQLPALFRSADAIFEVTPVDPMPVEFQSLENEPGPLSNAPLVPPQLLGQAPRVRDPGELVRGAESTSEISHVASTFARSGSRRRLRPGGSRRGLRVARQRRRIHDRCQSPLQSGTGSFVLSPAGPQGRLNAARRFITTPQRALLRTRSSQLPCLDKAIAFWALFVDHGQCAEPINAIAFVRSKRCGFNSWRTRSAAQCSALNLKRKPHAREYFVRTGPFPVNWSPNC